MRAKHTGLLFTAGLLLMPTLLWSQFPGGFGGGPPGGEGRPRMQMDPDQLFNFVSKGQDVIRVDQLDPFSKSMFDRFASRFGLTGNEITRDQFKSAMTQVREMAAAGQVPGGMNFQRGPGPGGPGGDGSDVEARIEQSFQRRDRNQDGLLSVDEMSETLAAERDKWDTNHDGFIDLNEYKAYMKAGMEARQNGDNPRRPGAEGPNGRFDPNAPGEEERKRPTIVRAGNLPQDFPYAALDTDQDGQIGLYEWKAAGHPISEFLKMDLNGDGFLTVEEYYGWRKQVQDEMAKASGTQSGGDSARGGRGMGGRGGLMAMGTGGGGRGMGGFGMGGGNWGPGGGGFGMGGGPGGRGFGWGMGGGGFGSPMGMGGPGMGMGGGNWGGRGFGMGGGNWGGGGMPQMGFGGGSGAPGGNWGGGGMPGGDRSTFARGPGGDNGTGDSGAGRMPVFTPPGGDGDQAGQFVPPGGMMGPRGDRGPGMGGDRGPGGRLGGPDGERRERPRKNRDQ